MSGYSSKSEVRLGLELREREAGDNVWENDIQIQRSRDDSEKLSLNRREASTMSVSAIFGSRLMMAPHSLAATSFGTGNLNKPSAIPRVGNGGSGGGVAIECSSRPQKKATAHHKKTRPRKTQPWDIKRKATVYPPLPPLPPDWTLISSSAEALDSSPPPSAPSPQGTSPASSM